MRSFVVAVVFAALLLAWTAAAVAVLAVAVRQPRMDRGGEDG